LYGNENHFHLWYGLAMNISIVLAALTALATTAGGFIDRTSKNWYRLKLCTRGTQRSTIRADVLPARGEYPQGWFIKILAHLATLKAGCFGQYIANPLKFGAKTVG